MVRKQTGNTQRKINSTTARMMMTYSSYQFKRRLLQKIRLYKGRHVIPCTEEYTTQTCCRCGARYSVKGSKMYECRNKECGISIDRDINGAANIMIKYVTEILQNM